MFTIKPFGSNFSISLSDISHLKTETFWLALVLFAIAIQKHLVGKKPMWTEATTSGCLKQKLN